MSLISIGRHREREVCVHAIHTGHDLCYCLRREWAYSENCVISGHHYGFRAEIGCIDAPEILPGGSVSIEDCSYIRFVSFNHVSREFQT